jgi:hypothetical protein
VRYVHTLFSFSILSEENCPNFYCALMLVYMFGVLYELNNLAVQVLVGESLVKQDDPCAGIAKLFGEDISRRETSVA